MRGWIGVDLDGTLAIFPYDYPKIGPPVPAMVHRVKEWLDAGVEVRIVTARVAVTGQASADGVANRRYAAQQRSLVEKWCQKYIGRTLPVTAMKDFQMIELWDDRAVRVEMNTGRILSEEAT